MKDENRTDKANALSESFTASAKRVITVDVNQYQKYLDGSDLSPEQKEEYLRTAWTIMMTFVELGFGVHPVQEACGQPDERVDSAPETDSNEGSPKEEHKHARGPDGSHRRGLEAK